MRTGVHLFAGARAISKTSSRAISTTSSTRVGVALWRGILREARVLDADPVRRTLLASPLLRAERSPTETPLPASVEHPDAERALVGAVAELRVTGRSTDVVASPVRFRDALSRQLATLRAQQVGSHPEFGGASQVARNAAELGDAGFAMLRYLGGVADAAERAFEPPAPETATAPAAAAPAHLGLPRGGDFLAADPFAYPQRFLERFFGVAPLAVLVLEAPSDGRARGVVLNAPSCLRLRHRDWMRAIEVPSEAGVFAHNRVLYGGPDSLAELTMLHPHGEHLPAARRVADGIYEGGYLADAAQLVRSGRAQPTDFVFFRGHSEWAAGRLAAEVAAGDWVRAPPPRVESAKWLDREMARVAQPSYTSQLPDDCIAEPAALAAGWETWAALVRRCGRAYRPLLRLRPAAFRAIVEAAAYSNLASVLSRPPSLDEELPAYAKGDGRDEWVAEEDKY